MPTPSDRALQLRSETFILRLSAVDAGEEQLTWRGSVQRVSSGEILSLGELGECLDQLQQWLSSSWSQVYEANRDRSRELQ